jgi:hypothetical protein
MNRSDWLWILIKGFGIYAGIQALLTIPPLLGTYWTIQAQTNDFHPSATTKLLMLPLWQQILTLLILINVSIYLLRSGRMVHWLVGPITEKASTDNSSSSPGRGAP